MTGPLRFPPYALPHLCERPSWWQVRVDEITEGVTAATKGEVMQIATSAAGFPVPAVAYGPPRAAAGTATWALGSNSGDPASYKPDEAGPQVVMLIAGVHAAEPEAIVGCMNLIALLETGKDLRGQERPHLVALAADYRLILLPCVNMDGRAVSPDHLRGATEDEFRIASQGTWTDGSQIGYPACKKYAPLPLEKVRHPGGYPNADGYNIMHDCCPGDLRTDEARGLLKLVADEQADLTLHMHSHSIGGQVLGVSLLDYPLHVVRAHAYKQRIHDALDAAGLRPAKVHSLEQRGGTNLTTACAMASGGLSFTFEQSAGDEWSFDEALETFYVTVETCLEWGNKEPFSPRRATARGQTEV
jgi:Zinc carboxypeptidase